MVTFWENPSFKLNPHLATSGMDGGAMCSYLWDWGGYVQQIMPLILGKEVKERAMAFKGIDLTKYYAYAPDGSGVGVKYSYSVYSFIKSCLECFSYNWCRFRAVRRSKKIGFDR
jgi:hypothetical protein